MIMRKLCRALHLPPRVLARKVAKKIRHGVTRWSTRRTDLKLPTYSPVDPTWTNDLPNYFPRLAAITPPGFADSTADRLAHWLNHEFDLLGSGWTQVHYGLDSRGFEGIRFPPAVAPQIDAEGNWLCGRISEGNLLESQYRWRQITGAYLPIDWQLDFKSGYRWSETAWFRDIRYGQVRGADIKVPWELARMEHLPVMALAFGWRQSAGDLAAASRLQQEFRNQILDFVATNPPRFGVQWTCAMDVALRAANWIVAHDLFGVHGAVFDPRFQGLFCASIVDHVQFITTHLEWNEELRGNHYLANLVGLIFALAWLPPSREHDAWFAFAVAQLTKETQLQFDAQGANFEASTCYHLLSTELVFWATALVSSLPKERRHVLSNFDSTAVAPPTPMPTAPLPFFTAAGQPRTIPFPPAHISRLRGMARFLNDTAWPDGSLLQIGDNDSGYFLRGLIVPGGAPDADAQPLSAAITAFCDWQQGLSMPQTNALHLVLDHALTWKRPTRIIRPPLASYPSFGLWVYNIGAWHLTVRCGPVGQNGFGGHAHNDQLSLTLALDGVPFIVDPGSFVYTALPEQRNQFRSTAAHNVLALAHKEQNSWGANADGLFRMPEHSRAFTSAAAADRFVGEHQGFGVPCRRTIKLDAAVISIIDECAAPGTKYLYLQLAPGIQVNCNNNKIILFADRERILLLTHEAAGTWDLQPANYAPEYGRIVPSQRLVLQSQAQQLRWCIRRGPR